MNIKRTKIIVKNAQESAKVQNRLFELGATWNSSFDSDKLDKPSYVDNPELYVDDNLQLGYSNDKSFYNSYGYREITVKELLKSQTMKELLE